MWPERTDGLKSQTIRFSQPEVLNDPFEVNPSIKAVDLLAAKNAMPPEQLQAAQEQEYLNNLKHHFSDEVIEAHKKEFLEIQQALIPIVEAQLPWMSRELNRVMETVFLEHLRNNFLVLSLTETPVNQLMWAHYAKDHKGFVLVFDENHSFFNRKVTDSDELRHLRKVIYSDERPELNYMDAKVGDFLLTKNRFWEYEREWRMIMLPQMADIIVNPNIYLFKYPPECVEAIIYGVNTSQEVKEQILEIREISFPHILIGQAALNNRNFEMNINPVNVQ